MPFVLDRCPRCGSEFVNVLHPILECTASADKFSELQWRHQLPSRTDGPGLTIALFSATSDLEFAAACIEFVGSAVLACLATVERAADPDEVLLEDELASECRVDALVRVLLASLAPADDAFSLPDCPSVQRDAVR